MKIPDGQVLLFKADGLTINVEVKELVLCKNCKHSDGSFWCYLRYPIPISPNDFCSKAERREE